MHLRKLTLTVGLLGGALCTNLAYSLGLGEITLKSALDEPLNAEIKLLQVRDLTSGEIIIGLASIDDFKRAGVDRVFFLQDLKFEVLLNNPGGPIVKVTSRKPVQEPYVNFLVQTRWPSGRLLREYTLLLDLPVFADKPAQPVRPAQARPQPAPLPAPVRPSQAQTSPATAVEPSQPVRPAPAVVTTEPVARSSSETSYPDDEYAVQANDTLWEIALRVRPNRSVSVQQTMVALQRINPNAFINDNINLLKKGQILKIPDQNEIENIEQREAIGTVAYQNDQWAGSDSASGAQLEGSSASSSNDVIDDEPRGQLTLAAPSDVESVAQSSGSGDASEVAALENDLSVNLEELDSARRESDELNTSVGELDEQIETIERLIDVSSEEMRALQLAAENTVEDSSETATGLVDDVVEQAEGASESLNDTVTELGEDVLVDADQAIVEPEAVEPEVVDEPVVEAPVVIPAVKEKSFMEIAMENLWYIIAAVLALIAGVGFFMHRKAQAEMAAFDELDDELYEESNFDSDEFGADEEALDTADDDYDLDSIDGEEPDNFDESEEPTTPTEAETGDAVGEADIYIAYGKYDQAEEMLQRAIIAAPNNIPARLKLLEVYAETKNIEKFDVEYAQVIDFNDSSANREAEELRARIPGAGEFNLAAVEAVSFGDDLSDELDFGDDLSTELDSNAETLDSLQNDLSSNLDDSSDFGEISLDFDSDDSSSESTLTDSMGESLDFDIEESSSVTTGDASSEFELNLDLDDLEGEVDAKDLIAESEGQEDSLGDIDFSIDLDEGDSLSEAVSEEVADEEDLDSGLTLDLDDSSEDPDSPAISDDDDFLSDLEFTAGSQPSEPAAPTSDSSSSLDDAFDLDMDNVDLAALDEEMDALVGDLDDEPTLPVTESAPELVDEDLGSAEIPEDFNLSEDVTDLDDMISLDEPSLDELSFSGEESDLGKSLSNDIEKASVDALSFEEDAGVDDDELGSELDFLADTDEVATKLDLARAYIDMGDKEGAKDILDEVVSEGNDEQKLEAQELIGRI